MNEVSKLRYLVPRWLMHNARTNEQTLKKDDAINLYEMFSKKLHFHSPIMRRASGRWVGDFRIKLKNPVLKGSRRYKLPMMSLAFTSNQSNGSIFTDFSDEMEKPYALFSSLADRFCTGGDDSLFYKRLIKEQRIAIHPHVSSDGNPCLGDFSGPWSMSLQTNNLLTMVQVANSFLNNWTRRDCYWDINRVYQTYEIHKTGDFKQYLLLKHVMNELARVSMQGSFRRTYWEQGMVSHPTYQKCLKLGWSKEDLFICWKLHDLLTGKYQDTEELHIANACQITINLNQTVREIGGLHSASKLLKSVNYQTLIDEAIVNDKDDCRASFTEENLKITEFGSGGAMLSSLETANTKFRRLRNIDDAGLRSDGPPISISQFNDIRRGFYNTDRVFKKYQGVLSDDEYYERVYVNSGRSSHDYLYHESCYLYVLRSLAFFVKLVLEKDTDKHLPDIDGVQWSFDEVFDCKQLWALFKHYSEGINRDEQENQELRIAIGKRIAIAIDTCDKILQAEEYEYVMHKWKAYIRSMVYSKINKQLKEAIRSIDYEEGRAIRRAGINGTDRINTFVDSGENQLSIETF